VGSDYTVILFQRQHFGDEANSLLPGVPFVGKQKDYRFDCPDINSDQAAVLFYNSYDAGPRDRFEVNGKQLYGGIYEGPGGNRWASHELLVEREFNLKPQGNVLHVEARTKGGNVSGNLDDFILDNVVIMYKTAGSEPLRG
jgi:hypothetical protein